MVLNELALLPLTCCADACGGDGVATAETFEGRKRRTV